MWQLFWDLSEVHSSKWSSKYCLIVFAVDNLLKMIANAGLIDFSPIKTIVYSDTEGKKKRNYKENLWISCAGVMTGL